MDAKSMLESIQQEVGRHKDAIDKLRLVGTALKIVPVEDVETFVCMMHRYLKLEAEVMALDPDHVALDKNELAKMVKLGREAVSDMRKSVEHTEIHLNQIEQMLK